MDGGSTRARRLLITGAAGLIGTVLMRGLEDRYVISGVDRARRRPKNVMRVDLAKSKADHCRGYDDADVVIDLAGISDAAATPNAVWKNNIPATMNSLEAARRAGVRRYIFASSNHVTGMYEREWPWSAIVAGEYTGIDPDAVPQIRTSSPIRPDNAYAVGKALGEVAARWYSDTHGLSAICLRIGSVNRADRPEKARHFATLLTHADLLRLVECALEAPEELRFGIYYGVSRNTWRFWDISDAAADMGYDPQDDAERFR
jgi:nucleoside-diphosphate-sugar epimerase